MDLAQLQLSTVILVIAGLALLVSLGLSAPLALTVVLTAKIVAVVGLGLAIFNL